MMPAVQADTEETRYGAFWDARLMARFLSYATPHRGWLMLAMLMPPIGALSQLAQPLVIQMAVDRHLVTGDMEGFGGLLALLAGLGVLQFVSGYLQSTINARLGQRVISDLRRELFAHLITLDAAYFAKNPSGALTNRIANDAEAISQMVSAGLINLIGDILLLIAIAVGMVVLSPRLSLVVLLMMPVVIGVAFRVTQRMRMIQRHGTLLMARMTAKLTEENEGRDVVRLFHQQKAATERFGALNREHRANADKSNLLEAFQFSFVETASTVVVAVLFWHGAGLMTTGEITIGVLTAFIDAVRRLFFPIRDLAGKFTTMQSAMSALERVFALLDTKPAIVDPPETRDQTLPARPMGAIRLAGVSFAYGEETILANIDLEIAPGERIAIVGPTGAGKSTLIKLINRTIEAQSGQVTLDGIPVGRIPLAILRQWAGVARQETFLFSGTIAENIGLFDPRIDRARIERAAEESGAMAFIRQLPDGLDARLTERGSNLSAGQRQLLGMTRILALDPPILILDEATSSVDAVSERLIQAALERIMTGRTAVIIAHRLSTIRHVDRIIVLAKGRIIESGSHEALLAHGGLFAQLHALQFQDPSDAQPIR
ncbi:ATP-binding cassette, subfamily B, multidrug efflux pump MdlB [Candidatus Magnetaquicoccaceae bacterium FCR-1]|uniref:ATP-binding cassette, subfamily B, multidrug efflux pump MdlB n=1 Tax=Candidatus Magnetaquiglobus chichijimensis TaxID=3141448 RepID=A0ABQ0CCI6_9PROT